MKEFEQGVTKNVQETSKQETAAAAQEAAHAPAAKAPISPVPPTTTVPVVPSANAVSPAPQKAQSRALPYVMMVVAFILSGIVQSVLNILYNNYILNAQGYNSFSDNIMPWLQSAVSIFLTLAIGFFAGLIAYKRFRKTLGFLLIFVGAQSIIELPQALLSLISALLVGNSSVSFFALFNALHLLFGVLAIILACLIIRYFSSKAE